VNGANGTDARAIVARASVNVNGAGEDMNANGTNGAGVLVVMVGTPGSGKSKVARERFAHLPIVDMDELKKTHPDYDPKNPATVHAWSQREAIAQAFAFLAAGVSFVFDSTGMNVARVASFVEQARERGMEVHACVVRASLAECRARNQARARTVAEHGIFERFAMVDATESELRRLVNRVECVWNDARAFDRLSWECDVLEAEEMLRAEGGA